MAPQPGTQIRANARANVATAPTVGTAPAQTTFSRSNGQFAATQYGSRYNYDRYHRRFIGPGVGFGVAFGGPYYSDYYDNGPYAYYDNSYYDAGYYDEPYAVYDSASGGPADVDYCIAHFRSYDPASGTYLGFDGMRHPCP
jgi:hypothetical protein